MADLDESILFYTDVLGIADSEKRDQNCFFPVGENSIFALIQFPGDREAFNAEMRPSRKGKAFTHFRFQAPTKDAFALQDRL